VTTSWYTVEVDSRGVETTRIDFGGRVFRAGARGTRLLKQLEHLGLPDGALREVTEAAAAWTQFSPEWVGREPEPAGLRDDEGGIKVAHLLRALGISWDEALRLGEEYRTGTPTLDGVELSEAMWPPDSDDEAGRADEATIARDHRVILIRIPRVYRPGMSEEELYEGTRKSWRASPERHSPDLAFSVVGGKVLAVYRIGEWHREDNGRWSFTGTRDEEMEGTYLGADVSNYFPRGAANPITYVNC
jgi:hypothetical protein